MARNERQAPARFAASLSLSFSLPLSLLWALALTQGCAAAGRYAPARTAADEATPGPAAPAPAPLQRSIFAREAGGQLTEDALQKILDAPLELALPARVGVLPIVAPADYRGPGPDYRVPAGAGTFAGHLRAVPHFTLVTEVMPIPSGALGMEALREIAARYRLRYLVLYREEIAERTRPNGWAAGYPTLIGAFFLPGQTLRASGFVEASLFDVKTGLLLFTVRTEAEDRRISNVWNLEDKLRALTARLVQRMAPLLAREVGEAATRLKGAAAAESARRLAQAQVSMSDAISAAPRPAGAADQ